MRRPIHAKVIWVHLHSNSLFCFSSFFSARRIFNDKRKYHRQQKRSKETLGPENRMNKNHSKFSDTFQFKQHLTSLYGLMCSFLASFATYFETEHFTHLHETWTAKGRIMSAAKHVSVDCGSSHRDSTLLNVLFCILRLRSAQRNKCEQQEED